MIRYYERLFFLHFEKKTNISLNIVFYVFSYGCDLHSNLRLYSIMYLITYLSKNEDKKNVKRKLRN